MTHSFCMSLPYGIVVIIGGIIGYFKKGSIMSLVMGFAFGGASTALGYSAYMKLYKNASDKFEIVIGLMLSAILSFAMGSRALNSGKFMPAGLVAALSIAMSIFYIFRLVNPTLPKKKDK